MLRIQIVSDLHIEFLNDADCEDWPKTGILTPKAPVLALLGDIGVGTVDSMQQRFESFISWCCSAFSNVIFVSGNHEYYNDRSKETSGISVCTVNAFLNELDKKLSNFLFLNKRAVFVDGVLILGTTLWSHVPEAAEHVVESFLNDYKLILNDEGKIINAKDTTRWHANEVEWIEGILDDALSEIPATPVVILTHHAPSCKGTSNPRFDYTDEHPNYWVRTGFSSPLDCIIEKYPQVRLWCYGHTHYNNFQWRQSRCGLMSNQRGYKSALAHRYSPDGIITVTSEYVTFQSSTVQMSLDVDASLQAEAAKIGSSSPAARMGADTTGVVVSDAVIDGSQDEAAEQDEKIVSSRSKSKLMALQSLISSPMAPATVPYAPPANYMPPNRHHGESDSVASAVTAARQRLIERQQAAVAALVRQRDDS